MRNQMISDLRYVESMLESIDNISRDTKRLALANIDLNDEMSIRLLSFNLEQIGEQVSGNRLSEDIKAKFPYSWKEIADLRILVAHQYGKVKPKIIIDIIQKDVPQLKEILESMKLYLQKEIQKQKD